MKTSFTYTYNDYIGKLYLCKLPAKFLVKNKWLTVYLVKAGISKSKRQLSDWAKERWQRNRVKQFKRREVSRPTGDIKFLMFVSKTLKKVSSQLSSRQALMIESDSEKKARAYKWLLKHGFYLHYDGDICRYIYLCKRD